jgi:hypothetical protein
LLQPAAGAVIQLNLNQLAIRFEERWPA